MGAIDRPWPTSLGEAVRRAARDVPERGVAVFDGRARHLERHTYPELEDLAMASARRFRGLGVEPREPVLVALPTSWEWLEAWFGLLMLGAWPVASSGAGAMAAAEAQFDKVERVMANIGARFVVASETFQRQAMEQGFSFAEAGVITTDAQRLAPERPFERPSAEGDDIAFLQLTSGSTGVPRAVAISHRAAIHNPLASTEAIGAPRGAPVDEWTDGMVSWLPLYHDMGLIGCLILPLLTGLDTWLLRPQTFLARPALWLHNLGTRGSTFTPAPNFGYQLCVERVTEEHLVDLDLSSWKVALTGAEMVRPETSRAFCDKFAACGFDETALRPCYGLAEATLAVTFDVEGKGVRTRTLPVGSDAGFAMSEVVSNGKPLRDTRVRIAAPDSSERAEDEIGEVLISGPGLFSGYYNDAEATAECLHDGWFRTGDLGFLHDGELYLTGRTKDLLIVHGQNIMPDDIERLADGVTGGGGLLRSAAFSVARGPAGEEAVVVVEVDDNDPQRLAELGHRIRSKIGRAAGLPLADLVFVRRGRIPRTTSGKMQRSELRQRYIDGRLERV